MKLTCDEVMERIFTEDLMSSDVAEHLNSCPNCKSFAEDYKCMMASDASVPELPGPSAELDGTIAVAARRAAFMTAVRRGFRSSARIAFPVAAAFAICGILFLQDVKQRNMDSLAVPTQATIAGDWTGAKMDEQIAEINFGMQTSFDNMEKSADDLLLAQIEADFARYVQ